MQTRKDLLQAHRLMTQRAGQALVLGEPDDPEQPLRRLNVATFCGVMVALLAMAAFGVYGLIKPGGATGLKVTGMLIVESDNGARYVWCQNGELCPVTNYVSARLLAGTDSAHRRTVSASSLGGFPRGPQIGIAGAPNTLPDADKLTKGPWAMCVRSVQVGVTGQTSMVSLVVGQPTGGAPLAADRAVVVQADKADWLLWKGRRMALPSYEVGSLTTSPATVAAKWLNAIPVGPAFQAPAVPGRGDSVPNGPAGKPGVVGQLYQADVVSGTSYYVLLSDGLAPISSLEMQLLLADPASKAAYSGGSVRAIQLDAASASAAGKSATHITNAELQGQAPTKVPYQAATPLCAVAGGTANATTTLTLGGSLPAAPASVAAQGVDQLVLPPGGASVAGVLPPSGKTTDMTTYYLVTEGHKYALPSKEAATKLGYTLPDNAVPVPAGTLGLIPSGPVLDPAAAAKQVTEVS